MFRAEKKHIKSNSLILEKIILVKISVQINSNRYIYSMLFLLYRKNRRFLLYNKVKLPWAVRVAKQPCTCGEATFLIV